MYSIAEGAVELGVSEATLRCLILRKEIPFHKIGRQYRFTQGDMAAFLKDSSPFSLGDDKVDKSGGNAESIELASALLAETKGLVFGIVTLSVHMRRGILERYTITKEQSFVSNSNDPKNERIKEGANEDRI